MEKALSQVLSKSPMDVSVRKSSTADILPGSWPASLLWRVISHQNGSARTFHFTVTAPEEAFNLLSCLITLNNYQHIAEDALTLNLHYGV